MRRAQLEREEVRREGGRQELLMVLLFSCSMLRGSPRVASRLWVGGQKLSVVCRTSVPVCAHPASLTRRHTVFPGPLTVLWKAHMFLLLP